MRAPLTNDFDVLILGAGAAGMMCAIEAGSRGRKVALLERSTRVGRKILISGGGRCNFTNLRVAPSNFASENPRFCASALARFTPDDFIRRVRSHKIPFHEKKLGQLFCDGSAQEIVDLLVSECSRVGAKTFLGTEVQAVSRDGRFNVTSNRGVFSGESLVVATGGLSIPKIGATDLGYRLARQFGIGVVPTEPALVGLTFAPSEQNIFGDLAGVALDAKVSCKGISFREALLFTHVGLSGPAALQISLYWKSGKEISVDLLPELSAGAIAEELESEKNRARGIEVKTILARFLPARLAQLLARVHFRHAKISEASRNEIEQFDRAIHRWQFVPGGTVGYSKAEVTRGGVDTRELSSKTMEARKIPGLYFVGEVVDVTGWLGGFNFQWAWSSGSAAGQSA